MTTLNDVSTPVEKCILCGSRSLAPVLDLGPMALTGVFPDTPDETLNGGPLSLVKCEGECGLVQLSHRYPPELMYGPQYGYRSSLNSSMVEHLRKVASDAVGKCKDAGDFSDDVLDIGSNDGTLLSYFPSSWTKMGVDPMPVEPAIGVTKITDFFSAAKVQEVIGGTRISVITSIAMFYDVANPLEFAADVRSLLSRDGVWVTEQSYLPFMLRRGAYDTICHEHLAYYGLRQFRYIADKVGLRILDTTFDSTNGGSFCVTLARDDSKHVDRPQTSRICRYEITSTDDNALRVFTERVKRHKDDLTRAITAINERGQCVYGYGASTKGNVVLQYCNLGPSDIPWFAEVNDDKVGKWTPASNIPIIGEESARRLSPDYFLVMPWHFKDNIVAKESAYLHDGGKLLFPLPNVEVWGYNGTHISQLETALATAA